MIQTFRPKGIPSESEIKAFGITGINTSWTDALLFDGTFTLEVAGN